MNFELRLNFEYKGETYSVRAFGSDGHGVDVEINDGTVYHEDVFDAAVNEIIQALYIMDNCEFGLIH